MTESLKHILKWTFTGQILRTSIVKDGHDDPRAGLAAGCVVIPSIPTEDMQQLREPVITGSYHRP